MSSACRRIGLVSQQLHEPLYPAQQEGHNMLTIQFTLRSDVVCSCGRVHQDREELSECLTCGGFMCCNPACDCPCPVDDISDEEYRHMFDDQDA